MTEAMEQGGGQKRVRGPQRTSREDWVRAALDTLISDGVASVKVAILAEQLDCARSSFYWFFKNRKDLLDALLDHWQNTNTRAIVSEANKPADSINYALSNVFSCWVLDGEFDTKLDFAIREWARRDGSVRRAVDISDDTRIAALSGMYQRFSYDAGEADIRARIVYFTQLGYEALDPRDSMLDRAKSGANYLYCLTGQKPTRAEVERTVALTGYSLSDIE
ncbi:MAG: TetR/AcrR family transcriptional regulator [Rhodobacteraceae bacterium]|nr:TetR/AcrR family transcriptional regulator [Paracoccaceae bacterium]